MDLTLVWHMLGVVVKLSLMVFGSVCVGVLIAGILQIVTRIDDGAITFAGKFLALTLFFYFAGGYLVGEFEAMTRSIWGVADRYY